MDTDAKQRLGALVRDLQGTSAVFKRHVIQMNRDVKIINHKHKARANDRLLVALERMKRDTTAYQEKLNALAKARAKTVGRERHWRALSTNCPRSCGSLPRPTQWHRISPGIMPRLTNDLIA